MQVLVLSDSLFALPHNRVLRFELTFYPSVNAIIFLAPISAFDQVLTEDPRVNRMEDSLLLWKSVVSNKLLGHVNLVLFLNKCDLLQVSDRLV